MVLLPIHGNPLQARFCGPFTVLEILNEVDYIISTPGRRKSKRLCHIYMLKLYHDREDLGSKKATVVAPVELDYAEQSCDYDNEADNKEVIRLKNSDVLNNLDQVLQHLSDPRKEAIKGILLEFIKLFPDVPGRTTAAVHDVDVGGQCQLSSVHIE